MSGSSIDALLRRRISGKAVLHVETRYGVADRNRSIVLMRRDGVDSPTLVAAVTEPTRRHLTVLERAGLVEGRKHGRELLYRVNVDQLDRATQSLSDLADTWDKRLTRIKRLAEAVAKDRGRT